LKHKELTIFTRDAERGYATLSRPSVCLWRSSNLVQRDYGNTPNVGVGSVFDRKICNISETRQDRTDRGFMTD